MESFNGIILWIGRMTRQSAVTAGTKIKIKIIKINFEISFVIWKELGILRLVTIWKIKLFIIIIYDVTKIVYKNIIFLKTDN